MKAVQKYSFGLRIKKQRSSAKKTTSNAFLISEQNHLKLLLVYIHIQDLTQESLLLKRIEKKGTIRVR